MMQLQFSIELRFGVAEVRPTTRGRLCIFRIGPTNFAEKGVWSMGVDGSDPSIAGACQRCRCLIQSPGQSMTSRRLVPPRPYREIWCALSAGSTVIYANQFNLNISLR